MGSTEPELLGGRRPGGTDLNLVGTSNFKAITAIIKKVQSVDAM